jgi:hypothetical protein
VLIVYIIYTLLHSGEQVTCADLGGEAEIEIRVFGNDGFMHAMEMGASAKKSRRSDTATTAAGRRSSTSNNSGSGSGASVAVTRKELERRRRQNMKNLCVKLASLIPREHYSTVSTW